MKIFTYAWIFVVSLTNTVRAQSAYEFKNDSIRLAQQKVLLELQKQILDIKQSQIDVNKKAQESDFKNEIEKVKAYKEILGDNKPTALNGSISLSEGKISTAEARSLVHEVLKNGVKNIQDKINTDNNIREIIFYNNSYFNGIPQYIVIKQQLETTKNNYDVLKTQLSGTLKDAAVIPAIATGIAAVNAIAQLATLFKTETEITANDEVLDESLVAAKLVNGISKTVYYPTLYPINLSSLSSSAILSIVSEIESKRLDIIKVFDQRQVAINSVDENITKKNAEINSEKINLFDKKLKKDKDIIEKIISKKEIEVETLKGNKKNLESSYDKSKKRFDELEKGYNIIKEKLDSIIDKESSISTLGILTRIEAIVDKINAGASTIRLSSKAKGTNKVTKFLWSSNLKSSEAVEIEYMIFDKDGKIIASDAILEYKVKKN